MDELRGCLCLYCIRHSIRKYFWFEQYKSRGYGKFEPEIEENDILRGM